MAETELVEEAVEAAENPGNLTVIPNREALRRAGREYGVRRPERSRIRRLSKKERAWRR